VGAALILLLIRCGGELSLTPGNDISVKLRGHEVRPFAVLPALQSGDMTARAWELRCVELGIARADLGAG
jgi:hypothetical protein